MLKLIVFRHGEASLNYSDDKARALTARGQQQVHTSIEANVADIAGSRVLLHSPYLRARQTAALINARLQYSEVTSVDWLTPSSAVSEAIESLYAEFLIKNCASITLVTHLPFVTGFIESLCGLTRGSMVMGTGSVACIEMEVVARGCGELKWQFHPDRCCVTE
ncbi:SixA phosphatase family protein [Teredinibacter franksiae]|uniref:SixA phosphatase family protein n=1 Tax=Teredinibacter franksiae TaxID=2761453 RepID=UPI001627ECA9|nr:histidine phosphatase family protein [Teredinibacter franksiae]